MSAEAIARELKHLQFNDPSWNIGTSFSLPSVTIPPFLKEYQFKAPDSQRMEKAYGWISTQANENLEFLVSSVKEDVNPQYNKLPPFKLKSMNDIIASAKEEVKKENEKKEKERKPYWILGAIGTAVVLGLGAAIGYFETIGPTLDPRDNVPIVSIKKETNLTTGQSSVLCSATDSGKNAGFTKLLLYDNGVLTKSWGDSEKGEELLGRELKDKELKKNYIVESCGTHSLYLEATDLGRQTVRSNGLIVEVECPE